MYEIRFQHPAERFIKQLPKEEQKKLLDAIEHLAEKPHVGDKLVGRLAGLRSLHTGIYRIIYTVKDVELLVLVVRAGYRRNIYAQKFRK